MSEQVPAWLSYLTRTRQAQRSPSSGQLKFTNVTTPMTPLERITRQEEASGITSEYLGKPSTGQETPGLLSRVMDVITFLPSVATSAVKEFIYDPVANLVNPGTTDKISIKEFANNVKERKFAQEQYSFLQYGKEAGFLEKAAKEVAGFGIDILSTGGFGGGIKVASTVGRKGLSMQIEGAAKDAFLKAAKKLAGESDDEFLARGGKAAQAAAKGDDALQKAASDFGAQAANAFSYNRSRGVADLFEESFGNGKDLFFSLPKEVQGGLQIKAFGNTLANWNSGGYLMRDFANGIGLPQLADTTNKAVKAFQNLKNTARAGTMTTPVVSQVLNGINKILNNVGEESTQWQKYLKAIVNNADEEDSIRAYGSFSEGVRAIQKLRDVRVGFVQGTKDFLRDVGRLERNDKDTYQKALQFMKDPTLATTADLTDEGTRIAKAFADNYRSEFDRLHKELIDNGFDVGYLENYIPLLYVRPGVASKISEALESGPRGIPGRGYDPTKARVAYMKDKIDPVTNQPVLDAAGQIVKEPMTPTEIKNLLISKGRKDLADEIQDDPLVLLAQYSTNVSRLLANKKIISDLVKRGILVKSDTLQVGLDPNRIDNILSTVPIKRLDDTMAEVLGEPGSLGKYVSTLNDDLEEAARTGDVALNDSIKERMDNLINIMSTLEKKVIYRIRKAAATADELEVARLKAEKRYLQEQQKALGGAKRVQAEPKTITEELAQREGVEYRQIGGGDVAAGQTFFLPPEFAKIAGEKALVESIERRMLLMSGDKDATEDFMKSVDAYLQFFRTSATFGKLSGFVLRNGYGALQNNYVIAGSSFKDHVVAADIAKARVITDYALGPLKQLSKADLASKRVDKLIRNGKLNADQAKLLKDDIQNFGQVQTTTIDDIREQVLEGILSKKRIDDNITQWDAYQTALKDGDVYDQYTTLPYMQGLDADDESILLLNQDPAKIIVRSDRAGAERGIAQRTMEGVLNFGVGPDTKLLGLGNVLSADVAGRNIVIRPTQLTRDFNQLMEEMVRTAPIITGLRKYGNTESGRRSAALLMKSAQFDYSNLTQMERNVFRRLMPFYTYTRNNVPAQLRVLLSDPTRIQRNLQFWDAVGNIIGQDDGSAVVIPSYISQMYGFQINDEYRKQLIKDKPAWLQAILANPIALRPETPVADLERYTLGGGGPLSLIPSGQFAEQLGSSMTPPIKAAFQVILQQNLYTKKRYSVDGAQAPSWAQGLDQLLKKATGGKLTLGVFQDPDTGDYVMSDAGLDFIKTLIPTVGTIDRTALPALEIVSGAIKGEPVKLSTYEERAVTNILSQFAGLNVSTVTEKTQAAELYNRVRNRKDNIAYIAAQQNIDPAKVSTYTNQLIRNGYDPIENRAEILQLLDEARMQGLFAPDYQTEDMSGQ